MMMQRRSMIAVLVGMFFFAEAQGECSSSYLPDLRHFQQTVISGMFLDSRETLQSVIDYKKSNLRNDDIDVELPRGPPNANETTAPMIFAIMDFQEVYPEEVDEDVESSGKVLMVSVPFISNGHRGLMHGAYFTDVKSPVTAPTSANGAITYIVDSVDVEYGEDGLETYTLVDGDGVLRIVVQHDTSCDRSIDGDFVEPFGQPPHFMNLFGGFDWGCDNTGDDQEYCAQLNDCRDEINSHGENVCIVAEPSKSKRCSVEMTIEEVTGMFKTLFPTFVGLLPAESLGAQWIHRPMQSTGVSFPCLD